MNKDNLIPGAHKLTPEENSLGGINSGISRRAKKRALEIARDILSMPVDDGDLTEAEDLSSLKDVSDVTLDVMTTILANMAQKAMKGDLRASQSLLTISGDYSTRQETKVELDDKRYNPDNTIYKQYVGIDKPPELTYYDDDGNPLKTIYGEEAKRISARITQEKMKRGETVPFRVNRFSCRDKGDYGSLEMEFVEDYVHESNYEVIIDEDDNELDDDELLKDCNY